MKTFYREFANFLWFKKIQIFFRNPKFPSKKGNFRKHDHFIRILQQICFSSLEKIEFFSKKNFKKIDRKKQLFRESGNWLVKNARGEHIVEIRIRAENYNITRSCVPCAVALKRSLSRKNRGHRLMNASFKLGWGLDFIDEHDRYKRQCVFISGVHSEMKWPIYHKKSHNLCILLR